MRKRIGRSVLIALAVLATLVGPAEAQQDAAAVRREVEEMRKSFEAMQQQYQKRLEELAERLRKLEAQPPPTAVGPAPVAETPAPGPGAPTQPPSALDLMRPRQPFGLYTQRSTNQFLFDIGVAADFVANFTQRNIDKAGAGTFRGRENRFFPREVEVSLFGQIDPFARGEVRIEFGEEERGAETEAALAEAHFTLLTLPFNTQLKMGQMRARYGWANERHAHDLPWTDVPAVYRYYFGEEGLVEKGVELSWIPPLPFYVELLAGAFNGDNEDAFGRGRIREPLVTGRLRTFFELTDEHALQLGVSVAHGLDADRRRHTLPGVDLRYKYRPDGWAHPLLTLGGEAVWSMRRVASVEETEEEGIRETLRTRTRSGWYAYGEVQPWRQWAFGLRYDKTRLPERGREWAIEPYVAFWPSEFLRFRLGYRMTERNDDVFSANDASARKVDELFFQATFLLGAHPAHPF